MFKFFMISALCAVSAFGQATVTASGTAVGVMGMAGSFGPVGITTALAGPMPGVTGAPYSARATTERIQMLLDGNRIVQTSSGIVARDSQGRIRREESLAGLKTGGGEGPQIIMIDDPVAKVHWTLNAQTKTAMKMEPPTLKPTGAGTNGGATSAAIRLEDPLNGRAITSMAIAKSDSAPSDWQVTKADLGTQSFDGVSAQGTRITRTIPAGEFGNELPLVITTETWYSPELKVLVMSKSSDPRMGDTTYTLTNIQRSEPSPSLFQVPEDYAVKDSPVVAIQAQKIQ